MRDHTVIVAVLSVSILIQTVAAISALRLIRVTGRWSAWSLIAIALLLMAVRRTIPLYRLVSGDFSHPPDLLNECVGLTLSAVMAVGIARIAPIFLEHATLCRQLECANHLQRSLLAPVPLEAKLASVADGVVKHFRADFCRIWIIRPGDLCGQGCMHAEVKDGPHVCRERGKCLHLLASSGRYTHLDGKGHRRVPFGCYKIGRIASGGEHKFLIRDVGNDPHVHDHEWARSLGLESFAGYQPRAPGGDSIGVLALFSKHAILPHEDAMLDGLGSAVALAVQQAAAEEALREANEELEIRVEMRTAEVTHAILVLRDQIAERHRAEESRSVALSEREAVEEQLRHAQKLEAIGQLAAGIAHEINTPTQYVGDNTRFVQDAIRTLDAAHAAYGELVQAARAGSVTPELLDRIERAAPTDELDYLFTELPVAITQTLEGVERISRIVCAMREFSHPGRKDKAPADLNSAIESTVTVARSEWKYVATMTLDLDPDLPRVTCFVSDFNQAILNLVVNAAHAIGDVVRQDPDAKGEITVSTRMDGDSVEVRVKDTGTGIPEEVRPKLFQPFFTTKEVGRGTGQGLSVVYGTVVKRHGGTVTFESETGKGTTFILRLPIGARPSTLEDAA